MKTCSLFLEFYAKYFFQWTIKITKFLLAFYAMSYLLVYYNKILTKKIQIMKEDTIQNQALIMIFC